MTRAPVLILLTVLAATTVGCSIGESPTATAEATLSDGLPPVGQCGDGICNGPETSGSCPNDCINPAGGDVPPLYFFYAVHTHCSGDYLPYSDQSMSSLDTETAANMIAAIEGMAAVMDRYGVKATWEVVHGTASGLCAFGGENHIFRQLQDAGHEIGAHAHRTAQVADAVSALRNDCGIGPRTNSGFIALVSGVASDEAEGALSLVMADSVGLGMTVGTSNLAPGGDRNPLAEQCDSQLGVGNDMWPDTGNLMFPWRPDYANTNLCADSAASDMVLIDHVSIDWLILPGQDGPPDVLGDAHFAQLQGWFDAALEYMEAERPERVAVWGFVTHINEYAVGSRAEEPPDPEALAALDRFLAYVDAKRAEGRVVYATASEIADLAFDGQ